jgi:hypothetical protein
MSSPLYSKSLKLSSLSPFPQKISHHIPIPLSRLPKVHSKSSLQSFPLDFLGVTKNLTFANDLPPNLLFDHFLNRKWALSWVFAAAFKDSKGVPVGVVSVVGLTTGIITIHVRVTLDLLQLKAILQEIQIPSCIPVMFWAGLLKTVKGYKDFEARSLKNP